MTSRRSSGSSWAERAVEPTTSQNKTVSWRRSASRGGVGAGRGAACGGWTAWGARGGPDGRGWEGGGGAVVQPRYHYNRNRLTRWTPMLLAPARAWSVFQQIFAEHWETFQQAHPRYQSRYYDALVHKLLACGNPVTMGYVAYRCLHCGQGEHVV